VDVKKKRRREGSDEELTFSSERNVRGGVGQAQGKRRGGYRKKAWCHEKKRGGSECWKGRSMRIGGRECVDGGKGDESESWEAVGGGERRP